MGAYAIRPNENKQCLVETGHALSLPIYAFFLHACKTETHLVGGFHRGFRVSRTHPKRL